MSRKRKEENYKVGYAMPPRHSRFQPGQSGNPTGRPKGKPTLASVLEEELQKPVVIIEHGRRKRLTKLEAIARQFANKAAAGDLRAISRMLDLKPSEARSKREINKIAAQAEADQDEPVDFIHGNKIPPVKGRPGGRPLLDVLAEIYGLRQYAPKPLTVPQTSTGPDRESLPPKAGDKIEPDLGGDRIHSGGSLTAGNGPNQGARRRISFLDRME